MEETEALRSKVKLLQQENDTLQQEKEAWQKEKQSLQKELESLKKSDEPKEVHSRYSTDFWVDVGDKLRNDTDAIKELIKNKTIMRDDVDPDGYSLLNLAAYYGSYPRT